MSNFIRNPRNDELESRYILSRNAISTSCIVSREETCFKGTSSSHIADVVPKGNLSRVVKFK